MKKVFSNVNRDKTASVKVSNPIPLKQSACECTVCGSVYDNMARLKRHMVSHNTVMNKEHCDICNKEFRNKVSLRTHRNMVHKLGRKYPCSYCGKILYSSQYLMKHETSHTGKKFKAVDCKFCGKTIEYTKLKTHELTHTGEKPF